MSAEVCKECGGAGEYDVCLGALGSDSIETRLCHLCRGSGIDKVAILNGYTLHHLDAMAAAIHAVENSRDFTKQRKK